MNLVSREEFEVVQAMAAKARAEQEALTARLAALEARLEELSSKERSAPRRKDSGKSPSGAEAE
jgi:BMFP domain-containing protein YqiC